MKLFSDRHDLNGPCKQADDMSILGKLFGIRVIQGEKGKISSSGFLIELYIEDDGNYFYKCSFDAFWLPDLADVVQDARTKTL